LRPGDQILSCNGVDFGDIAFTEAVAIMKSSSVLELIVRTCAGLDLFPGESSGYNSSASSITGDQSPCWGESSKRLSVVREESTSSGDRLKGMNYNNKATAEWSMARQQDRPVPAEIPKIPKQQQQMENAMMHSRNSNTTVIKLSEDGPTMINNTLVPSLKTINNTVYEEISNAKTHDSQAQKSTVTSNLMMKSESSKVIMIEQKRHSVTKIESTALENFGRAQNPSSEQSSLSDAINEELKKRAEKKLNPSSDNSESKIDVAVNKSKMIAPPIHNLLMDEFKRAHQRMFKNTDNNNETHQADKNLEVSKSMFGGVKLSMMMSQYKKNRF
jgi:harmonin